MEVDEEGARLEVVANQIVFGLMLGVVPAKCGCTAQNRVGKTTIAFIQSGSARRGEASAQAKADSFVERKA